MKKLLFLLLGIAPFTVYAQNNDSLIVKKIFDEALTDKTCYNNLNYLCTKIGGRICGSPQAAAAVEWSKQVMIDMGLDTVFLQEIKVHNWKRGDKEYSNITSSVYGTKELTICALGESKGTDDDGIFAEVVEVKSMEELKTLGEAKVKGKIVFFNRPMNPVYYYTFQAYGGAADQRVHGASEASKYGAIAVIVRSLSLEIDDFPHTGIMHYKDVKDSIPAVAVSTKGAEELSTWLKGDPKLKLHIISNCKFKPEAVSYNVIGEIKGSKYPDQYIVVGGHLDAWDNGQGAHDDGGGSMQSIEVLRLFKTLGIKPEHTLRAVMFMDEEVAQRGGKKYAELAKKNNEKHIAAIESDRGVFVPTGFSFDTGQDTINKIMQCKKYLEAYGIHHFEKGGSGVDIGPMKGMKFPLIALVTESQRYFDYQHAPSDTFDKVNRRELQLGSAAIAVLVYFIDKYGY